MLALSIRQPFAELILRGIKRVEYRSRPTRIVGERFWIYASKNRSQISEIRSQKRADLRPLTSDNLATGGPPPWMVELAEALRLFPHELPRGVIVGSAVIEKVSPLEPFEGEEGMWQWHLADVQRAKRLRKPIRHPQPVWFEPF